MISINGKRVANAVGTKTARPCDSCIKKRARWYCAADDAFLCQTCDSSVHSANPLARRHERVRLKSLDLLVTKGVNNKDMGAKNKAPSWHEGFTRKARTPRHGKSGRNSDDSSTNMLIKNILQVPEDGSDDQASHEENEEEIEQQLLYRVPVFDPFLPGLCATTTTTDKSSDTSGGDDHSSVVSSGGGFKTSSNENVSDCSPYGGDGGNVGRRWKEEREDDENLQGILSSEMDLAQFAADVEILFGRGLEKESNVLMEELGLANHFKEEKEVEYYRTTPSLLKVKVEEGDQDMVDRAGVDRITKELLSEIDLGRDGDGMTLDLDLDFPYEEQELSPVSSAGGDDVMDTKVILGIGSVMGLKSMHVNGGVGVASQSKKIARRKMKILLSLDYDGVISAWGRQGGSPWTTGSRPDFDFDECWPDYMATFATTELPQPYRDHRHPATLGVAHSAAMLGDGGREARVSRYREKRRTRLFSKKIRYEVRKLNAEKRPRMKGRFVKRATFAESPTVQASPQMIN